MKIPLTEVAKKLGYKARGSIYLHFQDPDLPDEIIQKYATALKHDFTQEFPEMSNVAEPVITYKPKSIGELEGLVDYWKNKYIDLLEKHNEMVMKQLNKSDVAPT